TEYLKSDRIIALQDDFRTRYSYNSGVFVTVNKKHELRGCIGFPTPERKLNPSLTDAAIAAATKDPRVPSVRYDELNNITIEVTVLTPPEEVKVEHSHEYPSKIKVGRDGLIVKWEFGSGLLLPQVPVEYGWNEEEFLNYTCEKAGAPADCWKKKGTKILRFEGIVFKEIGPNGKVARVSF
ncbi:MAG: TIGR00296 family protein, partial [Thaumarchaeota archaeon]|nr:TIGR00296 family protein [Nitrososphaerota archaeon]